MPDTLCFCSQRRIISTPFIVISSDIANVGGMGGLYCFGDGR